MKADGGDHAARRRARARTVGRLLWSAQAEGLCLHDPIPDLEDGDGLSAVRGAVRKAIIDSCERQGIQFSEQGWQRFMLEIDNSVQNEQLALAWREKTWSPAVPSSFDPHSASTSSMSWKCVVPAAAAATDSIWFTTSRGSFE